MSLFRDEKIADPQLSFDNGALLAASATAGTTQAVPATVNGYIVVTINGVQKKIPYFNV